MTLSRCLRLARPSAASRKALRVPLMVLCLAVAAGLTACGSDGSSTVRQLSDNTGQAGDAAWQQLVEDAKAEGEVVFYGSHAEDTINELATAFEDEYGIKVQVFRASDNDLEPKLDAEEKTGNQVADLVGMSDQVYLEQMAAHGMFAEPTGPTLNAPEFDRAANTLAPGVIRALATTMSYAWNTDLHPQGLGGFDDLLDPSLSGGKIGILSPFTPAVMDFYTYLEKQYGSDFLDRLAQQKPRIYQAGAAMSEALASGEITAATQVSQVALYKAKDAGAPVDGGLAQPAWGASLYEAVLADARHPNAAQLLMNYIFSPAGQEIVAHHVASVLPDIPGAATTIGNTTTGGVMTAGPEQFKAFVDKFNETFQ
ncbi:MAG: extracellular solute-binding protein [Pseudonocardia sp.]|nr:MAG: extracellular solute-binding protein [Pseudonocardia sp.]